MQRDLSLEEKACNFETMLHIERVRNLINQFCTQLQQRAEQHDQSKLESPEVELFTKYTPLLKHLTYGSPEYEENRKALEPALVHHYAKNQHHPEHWAHGLNDMSLLDLIELWCDWVASSDRQYDGNLQKSLDKNVLRYNIDPQLHSILKNSFKLFQ